ncbi:receptor binding protein [Campylobacter phage F341]|nr:receptor binding protein [Campylobacter phage F341]
MAYSVDNVWSFIDNTEKGINKVPVNKLVLVKNTNSLYIKKREGTLNDNSTIQNAIDSKDLEKITGNSGGDVGFPIVDSNVKVIENPVLVDTDNADKGIKMYKIAVPADSVVQILGVFINNSSNGSFDSVPFDNIIKDNYVIVYTNSTTIRRIVYSVSFANQIDMSKYARLDVANTFAGNNIFTNQVTCNRTPTAPKHLTSKDYVDARTSSYGGVGQKGQKWRVMNIGVDRLPNVYYTNNLPQPIMIYLIANDIYIDNIRIVVNSSTREVVSFIIPSGSRYKTTWEPSVWWELR